MTGLSNQKVRFGEITGGEARELLAKNPVVLLPLGSHEDQGPHAPMGDYLTAERMAEKIALACCEQGTRTVVAPVLPFGGADFFGTMPGGIALSQSTLTAVLDDIFGCLVRHGFTRIIVINGHGGNVLAVHETAQKIYRKHGILIPSFYLWQAGYRILPSIVGDEEAKLSSGHGADPLSSVAMHLFPEFIRHDLVPEPTTPPEVIGLPISGFASVSFEGVEIQVPVELDEIAPNGVFKSDARRCSAERGKLLVDRITEIGSRFVMHYASKLV